MPLLNVARGLIVASDATDRVGGSITQYDRPGKGGAVVSGSWQVRLGVVRLVAVNGFLIGEFLFH